MIFVNDLIPRFLINESWSVAAPTRKEDNNGTSLMNLHCVFREGMVISYACIRKEIG